MPRNHVLMRELCLSRRAAPGIVRAAAASPLPTPRCDAFGELCCDVDTPPETHSLHVRLMTFLLPAPGLTAKLPANPHSRKPMQPLSCAHDSLSPLAISPPRFASHCAPVRAWMLTAAFCALAALAGCSKSDEGSAAGGQGGGKPPM